MDTEHKVIRPMRVRWVDAAEVERVGAITATEIRMRQEQARQRGREPSRSMLEVHEVMCRRWMEEAARWDQPMMGAGAWISEHMKRALAVKAKQDAEEKADRPMKEATYVRCNKCFACREYSSFIFHGARLSGCTCKMGEEEWVKVNIEVPAAEPSVKAP